MTSISSLSSTSTLGQVTNQMSSGQCEHHCDHDGDAGASSRVGGAGRGGHLYSALMQSLSQLGTSAAPSDASTADGGNGSTSSSSAGTNASQALHTFMHDLFAALNGQAGSGSSANASAQSSSANSTDSDGDNDGSHAAGAAPVSGGHQHGGAWKAHFQDKLQAFIQQLSSSDPSSGSANPAVSALQTDYQNLLSSLGASNGNVSLSSFLQSLQSNLQGSNPGLNVNTSA